MKKNNSKRKNQRVEKNTPSYMQEEYCFQMSKIGNEVYKPHWLELLPVAFFTGIIILITRMHTYERDMTQFSWISDNSTFNDFYSYWKMIAILLCAVIVLLIVLFRVVNQKFALKKSKVYIFSGVYILFVLVSYFLSDHKDFALLGYIDRFEGTLTLCAYIIIFLYIFNTINTSNNVKWVIYPITVANFLLSILGITQFYGKDFLKSEIGQKLITPNIDIGNGVLMHDAISEAAANSDILLDFTFHAGQIYQTVYNINYVSFYLALLIPLFGMLFISAIKGNSTHRVIEIIVYGISFALAVFNFLGSASSGGIFGLGVAIIVAIAYMNKKLISWIKPLIILVVIGCISAAITYSAWGPEVFGTIKKNAASETTANEEDIHTLHGIDIDGNDLLISIDDFSLKISAKSSALDDIKVVDQNGNEIKLVSTEYDSIYDFGDKRLNGCELTATKENGFDFLIFTANNHEMEWSFYINKDNIIYITTSGAFTDIKTAEAGLFKNNLDFGTGRGYIWSRGIPLMKDSLIVGTGADTFALAFPQTDYVGKYNADYYSLEKNMIVDKPHNMYLNMFITTGGVSFLAFMGILILYFVECFRIYRKIEYVDFLPYCGFGIFIGITGFAVAGLVNDSSVSVMPMFYGLLATGYAINVMLRKRIKNGEINAEV